MSAGLRKTTEQFIFEAREVHGNRFDYSLVTYTQAREKVEIICSDHGSFLQGASEHLSGKGCRKCSNEAIGDRSRHSTDGFTDRAKEKFGDQFDYSKVNYRTAWIPVEIVCREHGPFKQASVTHLGSTYGCPQCAHKSILGNTAALLASNQKRRITTSVFLERAGKVHGDRYDYSLVLCDDSKATLKILCKKHGVFEQVAGEHLSGKGCRYCGTESAAQKRAMPLDEFIRRARELHGDKYDYSLVEFNSVVDTVTIICPVHGRFEQSAWVHLSGGCRKCADEALPGRYTQKILERDRALASTSATLYYLKFWSEMESFFKIGITTTSIRQRYAGYGAMGYQYSVLGELKTTLMDAYTLEQEMLKTHGKPNAYIPQNWMHKKSRGGRSECFALQLPMEFRELFD